MTTYEKASADFEALLAKDADAEVTKLAKDLLENSKPEVKGAACHAIAKLRLKVELVLHGPESQVFAPVNEALRFFKEAGEKVGEASALNTLALAHLITGDLSETVSVAKEANRLASGFRDKTIAASIQDTLCQAFVAMGDFSKALGAAKERVSLLEAASPQDESLSRITMNALSTLADMQLKRGMKEASRGTAEKMAAISKKLGDNEMEAAANRSLSLALTQSGKADQAPNRTKAMAALSRAMGAIETKNESEFKKWWYEVEALGGVTDRDITNSLDEIRSHGGPEGMDEFLMSVSAPFGKQKSLQVIHQYTKRHMYVIFRTGGIQYGPRFQAVMPYRVGDLGGKAVASLKPSSMSEQWEFNVGYHSGILDGALQSGSVIGAPVVY